MVLAVSQYSSSPSWLPRQVPHPALSLVPSYLIPTEKPYTTWLHWLDGPVYQPIAVSWRAQVSEWPGRDLPLNPNQAKTLRREKTWFSRGQKSIVPKEQEMDIG